MQSDQEVMLTSVEQYRSEVLRLPRLTQSQERDLVSRARSGDELAKGALIESCLQYIASVAWGYACYLRHDDYLDLVGVGNLAIVECVEKALAVNNPAAYLRGVAKLAMKLYCFKHAGLITRGPRRDRVQVGSLDAPYGDSDACYADVLPAPTPESEMEQEQPNYEMLYQAINALTEKQRYVILRHLGLDGNASELLGTISHRLSANPKMTIARNRFNLAIKRLHRLLAQQ